MEKVVIFGGNGQLGRILTGQMAKKYTVKSFARCEVDITSLEQVKAVLAYEKPSIIVNTAAYTAVDKAEIEKEVAFSVNASGIENIGRSAVKDTRIIHISTDFVFSDPSPRPYKPEDNTNPVSVYGQSKLAGEVLLKKAHPDNLIILRTSWLYSEYNNNFVSTMLRLMGEEKEIRVVNDQYGSPTSCYSLGNVIENLCERREMMPCVCHWSDQGVISWFEFACEIERLAIEVGILKKHVPIVPVSTDQFQTRAKRPAYSALDSSKTEQLLQLKSMPWECQLYDVLKKIKDLKYK